MDMNLESFSSSNSWVFRIFTRVILSQCGPTNSAVDMMSILCLTTDAVSSGICFTEFKLLPLNVSMLTMFLHLSNFTLGLIFLADFSNTETRTPTSAEPTSISFLSEG